VKIIVDHIQDKALILPIDEPAETFAVLSAMQRDGECTFVGPVRGTVRAEREFDHIRVSGAVDTRISLICSRCLVPFENDIHSSFTIFFRKGSPSETCEEDEVELAEEDLVSATYSGNEIDLAHDIEEQVAMEVPLKPLCDEECKGLCPVCGIDRNASNCTCEESAFNFKFSALKDFKVSR